MQVVSGYANEGHRSNIFNFRLYHLSRPRVRDWRRTRHGGVYLLDTVDRLVMNMTDKIVAVDWAGWCLEPFNISTQCLESSDISKYYWPQCFVEPDLLVHRPTYTNNDLVVVKKPSFLRYATLDTLVNFLELWCTTHMVISLERRHIQHNHLKFKLLDLVKDKTDLTIQEESIDTWVVSR